jgi:hypothetical protein
MISTDAQGKAIANSGASGRDPAFTKDISALLLCIDREQSAVQGGL